MSAATRPERVFHYTTASGLHGILRDRSLWLSALRFCNDKGEIEYGAYRLEEELLSLAARSRELEDVASQALWTYLAETVGQVVKVDSTQAFSVSFCEDGDLLSQWRGYGGGGGFSIGFGRLALEILADMSGLLFGRCCYTAESQEVLVSEVVSAGRDFINCSKDVENWKGDLDSLDALDAFRSRVWELIPFFKDPAFSEEREWRLVAPASRLRSNDIRFFFRGGVAVPYWEFPLRVDSAHNVWEPLLKVVVGPHRDSDLALMSARAIVASQTFPSTLLKKSVIPFRS